MGQLEALDVFKEPLYIVQKRLVGRVGDESEKPLVYTGRDLRQTRETSTRSCGLGASLPLYAKRQIAHIALTSHVRIVREEFGDLAKLETIFICFGGIGSVLDSDVDVELQVSFSEFGRDEIARGWSDRVCWSHIIVGSKDDVPDSRSSRVHLVPRYGAKAEHSAIEEDTSWRGIGSSSRILNEECDAEG